MPNPQMLIQERLAHNSWGLLGNQGYVLGVDLGGYGLRAALVNLQTHTYVSVHTAVQGTEPQRIVSDALGLARGLLTDAGLTQDRLVRIGIGFGGPVDPWGGTVRLSPRMGGWEDFALKDYFENAFDAVTLVDNDANLIALAEATFGVGQGCKNLFYLHLSSGVGGGMVLDGRLYRSASGMAGEIGHLVVRRGWDAQARPLTLENLVSISGLLQAAQELGLKTDNLNDLFQAESLGQPVVHEATDLLATCLAQVVALLDPQIIVLGGIVVRIGGESFVQAIGEKIQLSLAPQFARPVKVVSSVLGTDSVAIGALALALESLRD